MAPLPTTRTLQRNPKEHLRRVDHVLRSVIDEVVREGGGDPPTLLPDPETSYAPDVGRVPRCR
jgi:hypothetical protein